MKNKVLLVALFALMGSSLLSCGDTPTSNVSTTSTKPTTIQTSSVQSTIQYSNDYVLELTELDIVDFHTDKQKSYLKDNYKNVTNYATGYAEASRPNAISLSWKTTATVQNASKIKNYEIMISTQESFNDYDSYTAENTFYELYNLKIATTYYWRVSANLENGFKVLSNVDQFETMDYGPRNLYVDGVTNVRDIGGWVTSSGKRVSQGKIIRSGRFNKSESETVVTEITTKGVDTMINTLGVKTEIDLRRVDNNEVGSIVSSPIDASVQYYSCPMNWQGSNILLDNLQSVRNVFSVLGDVNNYPIVYHCNIGTDRTGLFAYLINGLLGVSEEDLYRDYLFSNFGYINGTRGTSGIENSYVATIKGYSGATLSEKIKNCLIDKGVSERDIVTMILMLSR